MTVGRYLMCIVLNRRGTWTLAATIILVWQLVIPPVVGLANNGDFGKVIGIFNMQAPSGDDFLFADTRYEFSPRYHYRAQFYSTEQLLLLPALALNWVFSKDGYFDLRWIGVVHAAILLIAFRLFEPLADGAPRAMRLTMLTLAVVIFCDVMYVNHLNSFYMDAGALVFLLLTAVLYLRVLRWRRSTDTALLILCPALLVTSKAPHALLGLWIAVLLFATRRLLWPKTGRRFAIAALFLVSLSILWLWESAPKYYAFNGCYSVVFVQILPHAENVERTMAELGLEQSWKSRIGTHAYDSKARLDEPGVREALMARLSYFKLARFFLTHPRDAYVAMCVSLDEAGRQRVPFGNFDVRYGKPYAESRAFSMWSSLKNALFYHRGSRFLKCIAGFAAAFVLLLSVRRRSLPPGTFLAGLVLTGMMLTELAISSLADAVDVTRHYLIFFALFDLIVMTIVWLVMMAYRSLSNRNRGSGDRALKKITEGDLQPARP